MPSLTAFRPGLSVSGIRLGQQGKIMFYYNSLGKKVSGLRWEKVTHSKHFSDGSFKNIHGNQTNKDGLSSLKVAAEFLMHKNPPNIKPAARMPTLKTNLTSLNNKLPVLVWFGHSSYLIKYI